MQSAWSTKLKTIKRKRLQNLNREQNKRIVSYGVVMLMMTLFLSRDGNRIVSMTFATTSLCKKTAMRWGSEVQIEHGVANGSPPLQHFF